MRIPICDICGHRIPEERYQSPPDKPRSVLVGTAHQYADTCEDCEFSCATAMTAIVDTRRKASTAANLAAPVVQHPLPPAPVPIVKTS